MTASCAVCTHLHRFSQLLPQLWCCQVCCCHAPELLTSEVFQHGPLLVYMALLRDVAANCSGTCADWQTRTCMHACKEGLRWRTMQPPRAGWLRCMGALQAAPCGVRTETAQTGEGGTEVLAPETRCGRELPKPSLHHCCLLAHRPACAFTPATGHTVHKFVLTPCALLLQPSAASTT